MIGRQRRFRSYRLQGRKWGEKRHINQTHHATRRTDVDDTEHEAVGGKHGEVASLAVTSHWSASHRLRSVAIQEERLPIIVGVDGRTLFSRVANRLIQELVDLIRRVDLDVNDRNHSDQDGEDDHGVEVRGHEGCLETTGASVEDDAPRNQERGKLIVHSGESLDGSGTAEQKHRRDDDVGAEREEEEGEVGGLSPIKCEKGRSEID